MEWDVFSFVCFSFLAQLLTCKTSEARWRLLYGIKMNVKDCKACAYSSKRKRRQTLPFQLRQNAPRIHAAYVQAHRL